jgi:hypothetical protein
MVFENKVLRRIFETKGEEIIDGKRYVTRKLYLYSLQNSIREIQPNVVDGQDIIASQMKTISTFTILVGKPEVINPLRKFDRRFENNIKIDLK